MWPSAQRTKLGDGGVACGVALPEVPWDELCEDGTGGAQVWFGLDKRWLGEGIVEVNSEAYISSGPPYIAPVHNTEAISKWVVVASQRTHLH